MNIVLADLEGSLINAWNDIARCLVPQSYGWGLL